MSETYMGPSMMPEFSLGRASHAEIYTWVLRQDEIRV